MTGEWATMPEAGSRGVGAEIYQEIALPVANRLPERCNAILRVPGESKGPDEDVRIGLERGLAVFYNLEDVPAAH
jgi:hypothetical protein